MTRNDTTPEATDIVLLLALLATARFLPFPMQFSPFLALTLASGYLLRSSLFGVLALALFLATDAVLGPHGQSWLTTAFFAALLAGGSLARSLPAMVVHGVVGITAFYLVSNTVLVFQGPWYPHDASGVLASLVAGYPFYQAQMLGLAAVVVALAAASPAARRTHAVPATH
jgi:hypothetical protein